MSESNSVSPVTLPHWAARATAHQWQALKHTQHPTWQTQDWFCNAPPDLRETVAASHRRLISAQAALGRAMRGLEQVAELAERALQQCLQRQGLDVDVNACELLRVEQTWRWVGLRYVFSHQRENIVRAALQNFAEDEVFSSQSAIALSKDIHITPITVTGTAPIGMQEPAAQFPIDSERYQVTPLPLTPAAFATLTRALDLGSAYHGHLQGYFDSPAVKAHMLQVFKARLQMAADLAVLRHLISGSARDDLDRLLQGEPLTCWRLSLFGTDLYEVMLIDLGQNGLGVYLPNHEPALRSCKDLAAVHEALAILLLEPAAREAFTGYVAQDQREHFFDLLQQNLDAAGNTPADKPWERALDADLRPARQPIEGDPFSDCYVRHWARLQHEASLLAVPTAQFDASARAQRLATWESRGWDLLNIASFFVPGVGTFMLAVTACQLLGEAFEGYEAWEAGDRHLALEHIESVGINLALLGGFAAAGHALPRLFGKLSGTTLQEVRVSDGTFRLWNQDLAPYRSKEVLPTQLRPNAQGQYLHDGRYFIKMDGHLYEQRLDPSLSRWQIVHPERPDAWQPPLEHNGQGAWRAQHEPLGEWPLVTLVERLGEPFEAFTAEQIQQACDVTGIDADNLRDLHLRGQPAPPLLLDVLQRLRIIAERPSMDVQGASQWFEQRYSPSMPHDPGVDRLLTTYPRLTPPLARQLLGRLEAAQALTWEQEGTLPARIRQSVEQVHSELPLVRALEGLVQPALANTETERLLFSALEAMSDWQADIRLELRAGNPDGPTLAHTGTGQLIRVIKSSQGYEAFLGERPAPGVVSIDLCRAIEQALPRARRDLLGIEHPDGVHLRRRVMTWVRANRATLAPRLYGQRSQRLVTRGWLRGGKPLEPLPAAPRQTTSLSAAYRRLYPTATDAEFADWLNEGEDEDNLHDMRSPTQRLRDLQARLENLRRDLAQWAAPNPQRPHQRHLAVQPIINAWRRVSCTVLDGGGCLYSLDLSGLGLTHDDLASLPLRDDFHHIEHLTLCGNPALSQLPAVFHQRLPNLTRLLLSDCRFDHLPRLAFGQRLRWLDVDRNRITWDPTDQITLQRYPGLAVLDLSENPLLVAPDLRLHPDIRSLFLSGCSLTELPQGLAQLTEPLAVDLTNNQFVQLPEDFTLPIPVADTLSMESSWLAEPILSQIETYNEIHDVDLLVNEGDYTEFFELAGPHEYSLWRRLPLQYRRDLRALLDDDPFLTYPERARREFWRRLSVIDNAGPDRQALLEQPAERLFELDL
ncbi:leucine-rich repeat domain-containing protein [Pseudomonas fulva]|uniref:dermonecrotic toxin domain-containing protein n=1 Tax=Pseudomonas fulva TaxID=47880 RepID=UPI0031F6B8E4